MLHVDLSGLQNRAWPVINLRNAYGYLQTYVLNGEKNTPKFNKEYLWNHWTNLDHVNTIRREIYLSFSLCQKCLNNFIFMCIFLNNEK